MRAGQYFLAAALGVSAFLGAGHDAKALTAPQPGSEQYNILEDYMEFIRRATDCCSLADARGDVKEEVNTGYMTNGHPYTTYTVTFDPAIYGLPGPEVTLDIPPQVVYGSGLVDYLCGDNPGPTCKRPPFNVLWAIPNDESKVATGEAVWRIYCYIPRSNLSETAPPPGWDIASVKEAHVP